MSYLSLVLAEDYFDRMVVLLCAIVTARLGVRVCAPVAAIHGIVLQAML